MREQGRRRDRRSSCRIWMVGAMSMMIAAGLNAAAPGIAHADRNALWTIVHDQCVPDQESHQDPAPCEAVTLDGGMPQGYAILKDRVGATQFLLIPTRRISGMESPELLASNLPNYWQAAWQARRYVEARAKSALAWDMIGLAVNSALGRSQDQLHIHIDCVRPDVRAALAEHMSEIGRTWAELSFDLRGRHYFALRLEAAALATQDPFKLMASGLAASSDQVTSDLARETLVVVGAKLADDEMGFVLLADRADPDKGDFGHGEDLLDHACVLATQD
ncbi:MAG: CDP-diacylglycerol diphosphatase [Beijerinckiaceae bacterium]